eukprot:3170670-Rhodomonas_salina.1
MAKRINDISSWTDVLTAVVTVYDKRMSHHSRCRCTMMNPRAHTTNTAILLQKHRKGGSSRRKGKTSVLSVQV